ncbi:MAG: TolC family protein [Candidatus Omnitrophica bacterium]|nr:TolC family protein [Candidatus Omnitrophota bacterium]
MLNSFWKITVFSLSLFLFCVLLPKFLMAEEVLTWDDCVKEALKNHPELIYAQEQVIQSRADKNIIRANILPQISAQASEKKSKVEGSDQTKNYAYSVSAEQLLFDGLKTTSNIHAAEKSLDAAEYNYLVASSDIRLSLNTAFSSLLRAQELTALTEEIAKRRSDNLKLVKIRYEAGREHRGAVLTAEADLAQADFEVAQAKRNILLAQQDLIIQLGRKNRTLIKVAGDLNLKQIDSSYPNCEALADNTPFLKALIARKEAARFNYSSAKGDLFPKVYLSGSMGRSNSEWPPEDDAWSAGLTVSLPLFEGGSRIYQIEKAKSQWKQAQASERSGRDSVVYTLEKTWKDLQDARDMVLVKKKFLDAALERAKIANAQYSSGLTTFDNWIIIENNLVSAKKAYLDAQENLLFAQAYWIQSKGGILEYAKK